MDQSDFGGGSAIVRSGSTSYETAEDGYLYTAELVLADNRMLRLRGFVNLDGRANDAELDGHAVTLVARKTGDNGYQMRVADKSTGLLLHIFRYIIDGEHLTFTWFDGDDLRPRLTLIYERQ